MKLRIYQGHIIPERYRKGQHHCIIFRILKMVKTWENVYSKLTIQHPQMVCVHFSLPPNNEIHCKDREAIEFWSISPIYILFGKGPIIRF